MGMRDERRKKKKRKNTKIEAGRGSTGVEIGKNEKTGERDDKRREREGRDEGRKKR